MSAVVLLQLTTTALALTTGDGLVRYRARLLYDGADFYGSQIQPRERTVAGVLEAALAERLALPTPARVIAAGRTDTGVHARGQSVHFDLLRGASVAASRVSSPPRCSTRSTACCRLTCA